MVIEERKGYYIYVYYITYYIWNINYHVKTHVLFVQFSINLSAYAHPN